MHDSSIQGLSGGLFARTCITTLERKGLWYDQGRFRSQTVPINLVSKDDKVRGPNRDAWVVGMNVWICISRCPSSQIIYILQVDPVGYYRFVLCRIAWARDSLPPFSYAAPRLGISRCPAIRFWGLGRRALGFSILQFGHLCLMPPLCSTRA